MANIRRPSHKGMEKPGINLRKDPRAEGNPPGGNPEVSRTLPDDRMYLKPRYTAYEHPGNETGQGS